MSTVRDHLFYIPEAERRERIADLLARGVVRHLRERQAAAANDPEVAHKSDPRKRGLEVSARSRLHVTRG